MILLDTSLIIAYSNKADMQHKRAVHVFDDIDSGMYGTPAITDYIFDEVVTVMLARTKNFKTVVQTGEKLLASTLFFKLDSEIFGLSWDIFKAQEKMRLSFTDCSILATCRVNRINTIATFDKALNEESKLEVVD